MFYIIIMILKKNNVCVVSDIYLNNIKYVKDYVIFDIIRIYVLVF